jgi:hypothetical protein
MLTSNRLVFPLLFAVAPVAPVAQSNCVWGGFDASRINYAGGVIATGTAHVNLRTVIQNNGGALAPPTPTLTAAYLATVQVFYTSLLVNNANAVLSPAEQAALQTWVAGGGTLIVTGDIFALPGYDSFTSPYGVTGWRTISACATGGTAADVVAVHALTVGITTPRYCTNSTFTYPATARLLVDDGTTDNPFMVVMEPATGHTTGGRIVVLGDHNLFADAFIVNGDNMAFATNLVRWACGCPSAAWTNYGSGWPGTAGVPALTASANRCWAPPSTCCWETPPARRPPACCSWASLPRRSRPASAARCSSSPASPCPLACLPPDSPSAWPCRPRARCAAVRCTCKVRKLMPAPATACRSPAAWT